MQKYARPVKPSCSIEALFVIVIPNAARQETKENMLHQANVPSRPLPPSLRRPALNVVVEKVSPRMTPFYGWFTAMTVFLIAAVVVVFFPVTLPVPWAGIVLVVLVFSVSALPMRYGRVYVRDAMLAFSREQPLSGARGEGDLRDVGDDGEGVANDCKLEEDLFGGEVFPLLGSRDGVGGGHLAEIESRSLTWKQCLGVRATHRTHFCAIVHLESSMTCRKSLKCSWCLNCLRKLDFGCCS